MKDPKKIKLDEFFPPLKKEPMFEDVPFYSSVPPRLTVHILYNDMSVFILRITESYNINDPNDILYHVLCHDDLVDNAKKIIVYMNGLAVICHNFY